MVFYEMDDTITHILIVLLIFMVYFAPKLNIPVGLVHRPVNICKHFLWQALETVRQETCLVVGRTNIIKQTGWFLHTQCLLFTGVGELTIHDRSVSRVDFFQGLFSSVCRWWLPSVLSPQSPSAHASVLVSFLRGTPGSLDYDQH